jgi:hypothetical protein
MDMSRSDIDLHIEELALDGFASTQRHAIAEAIQLNLTEMLSASRPPIGLNRSAEIESLSCGCFHMPAGSRADKVGTQVAQNVYRGLNT